MFRALKKSEISKIEPLLETVWANGGKTRPAPSLEEMRQNRLRDIAALDTGVLRMRNPHIYHVSLSTRLLEAKLELINKFRTSVDK